MLETNRPTQARRDRSSSLQGGWSGTRSVSPTVWVVVGLVALLILGRVIYGEFFADRQPHKQPAAVIVAPVTAGNMEVVDQTIGSVIANATVQITPRIDGQVLSVHFTEGQLVKTGDLLFRIDPKPYEAALRQAQAALNRDSAQLTSAARNRARYDALARQGAVSGQQRDQAVADAGALAATVAADRAAVDLARLDLGYTEIRSPIDGKTGPVLVFPGAQVRASASASGGNAAQGTVANSSSTLVVINQIAPIKVSFSLPQSDLPAIQNRMASGKLFAAVGTDEGGKPLAHVPVDFLGNQVSTTTGTVELRATVPNSDGKLLPGELAQVTVALDTIRGALIVPHEAVNLSQDGKYVWVVTADGKADMRTVTVLHDNGKRAAISGKLKAGDRVVTDGQLRLAPGAEVVVQDGKRKSGSGR